MEMKQSKQKKVEQKRRKMNGPNERKINKIGIAKVLHHILRFEWS